jgi:bacterioferritin-associated ferredoxin
MIVCVCKAVSDKRIQAEIDNGAVSLRQIVQALGVGTCCGSCVPHVQQALAAANSAGCRTMSGTRQLLTDNA